nr:MAG TPA: hypothetical protein [Caudoviricetes sp.]
MIIITAKNKLFACAITKSKFYILPLTYQSVQRGTYFDANRILSDPVFDVPEI